MEYEHMEKNGLDLRIPSNPPTWSSRDKKIRFVTIGKKNNHDIKNVLLIGETGAGKTTMLNSIYNQFYGVRFEDDYRMKLFTEEEGCQGKKSFCSKTEYITSYLFYFQPLMKYKYNIRVIDTPGINDTRGVETQRGIAKQMKELLKNEDYGIIDLHCLGFVVKDQCRLVENFKKVAKDCMENFGRDTEDITYLLRTHTTVDEDDDDDDDVALNDMLKEIGLRSMIQFPFENKCLYKANKDNGRSTTAAIDLSKNQWSLTTREFSKFFESLSGSRPVSLKLTRELVQIKMNLEQDKQILFSNITLIMDQILARRENQKLLTDFKNNMDNNKDWKGLESVTETKRIPVKEKASWWHMFPHSHNCKKCEQSCKYICHTLNFCPRHEEVVHDLSLALEPAGSSGDLLRILTDFIPVDPVLRGALEVLIRALAITVPVRPTPPPCEVCGCAVTDHEIEDYIIEKEITRREVTDEEMRERYRSAESLHKPLDEIVRNSKEREEEAIRSIARMICYMVLQTEQLQKISRVKEERLTTKEIINEIVDITFSGDDEFRMKICEVIPDFQRALEEAIRTTQIDKEAWKANFENEKKKLNSYLSKCLEYLEKATTMLP